MLDAKTRHKVVKPLAKGQITIPAKFRQALGIDSDSLLTVSLVRDHLEVKPLPRAEDALRRYTEEELSLFMEEDKLDAQTAERVRELLARGEP